MSCVPVLRLARPVTAGEAVLCVRCHAVIAWVPERSCCDACGEPFPWESEQTASSPRTPSTVPPVALPSSARLVVEVSAR